MLVEVTLRSHRQADFDRFERAVRDLPEIVACWSVGGGVDYLLKVVCRDIDAYQRLIDGLLARELGIERYFTYIVTRTVKEESRPSRSPRCSSFGGLILTIRRRHSVRARRPDRPCDRGEDRRLSPRRGARMDNLSRPAALDTSVLVSIPTGNSTGRAP